MTDIKCLDPQGEAILWQKPWGDSSYTIAPKSLKEILQEHMEWIYKDEQIPLNRSHEAYQ